MVVARTEVDQRGTWVVRMVYLTAGRRSKDSTERLEGITMPRSTGRPMDERARARLRDAQRVEAHAVALVVAAELHQHRTQSKLATVIARHQIAIDVADHELSKAQAHLASVSGVERAALLLDQPVAALRAAVRSAKGAAREKPS